MDLGHIFGLDSQNIKYLMHLWIQVVYYVVFKHVGISPRLKADMGLQLLSNSNEEAVGGNTYISASTGLNSLFHHLLKNMVLKGGLHINAGTMFEV